MNKPFFIALFISVLFVFVQDNVDYNPKMFNKEIERLWGIKSFSKQEISVPVSLNGAKVLTGKFFKLSDENGKEFGKYVYLGRVNSCRVGGCSISSGQTNDGESEYFDYFILYDENQKVELVRVFNYQATHGQEVTAKGWLKQFIGYDGTQNLEVGKNVDAISGATISVYAITVDVEIKTLILKQLLKSASSSLINLN